MKKLLVLLVVVAAGLAMAAYWFKPSTNGEAEAGFTTESVQRGDITETIPATGTVRPLWVVPVGSELAGKVARLYVKEYNHAVHEGDPLLELDQEMAKLTLAQAEQAVEKAKLLVSAGKVKEEGARVALDLKEKLFSRSVADEKDVKQARLQVEAAETERRANELSIQEAQNAVEKARLGLRKAIVRSPASGTVLDRTVEQGQLIGPPNQGHLFTIAADLGRVRLHTQVAESDIGRVRVGQKVRFTVYAYSDNEYHPEGTVVEIREMPTTTASAVAQSAIYYDVIVDVKNEPRGPETDPSAPATGKASGRGWKLMPGMTANVDIILRVEHDVWKMPTAALGLQLDEHYQTERARQKLNQWENKESKNQWKAVWIVGPDHRPWPIFVRLMGSGNEPALSDAKFQEVLEWDPELHPVPDPKDRATWPKVITAAPPVKKSGLFDQLKLKF